MGVGVEAQGYKSNNERIEDEVYEGNIIDLLNCLSTGFYESKANNNAKYALLYQNTIRDFIGV